MKKLFALVASAALLAACNPAEPSADQRERAATAKLAGEASMQVGMPAVTHFQEKRMVKQLYEMRDNPNFRTYAYITDLNGGLHKLCDATGYGIPYATQFSNPQRLVRSMEAPMQGNLALPQPEPNGLFMPASADGTWIMCLDPKDKAVKPVFVEPRVIVSPFPLIAEEKKAASLPTPTTASNN
jgi:hypothetical protein